MKRFLLIFLFFFAINSFAGSFLKILYIADHTINCNEETSCLLTRDSPTEEWKLFPHKIEGLNYEKGYEYCILVEVREDTNRIQYILKEVKSKIKKDSSGYTNNAFSPIADSSKWLLYKLKTKDGTRTFSLAKAFLQFLVKSNTISGDTECNTFSGSYSLDSSRLRFENISTTKAACKKRSIEPDFLKALNMATHYKISSNILYLYKGNYLLALFTRAK